MIQVGAELRLVSKNCDLYRLHGLPRRTRGVVERVGLNTKEQAPYLVQVRFAEVLDWFYPSDLEEITVLDKLAEI